MRRHRLRSALRAARFSTLEENALVTALLLVACAVLALPVTADAGGLSRVLGTAGLVAAGVCAASRAVRTYRAGLTASLPTAVGRARVRARPNRAFSAATVTLALGLPLASLAAALALVPWAWLVAAGALLLGCAAAVVTWRSAADDYEYPARPSERGSELLRRLCIVADIPAPELVVEPGTVASAWTTRGRIHVTARTLDLLDDAELEAVLAHEVAHLAHRDAAVMDVCSAPSRLLLGFAQFVARRAWGWMGGWAEVSLALSLAIGVVAALSVPPAFVIGWVSLLSVLGLSRARELSADAGAAALTGRPSALASALMKLERQREWAPRSDLRRFDAYAVLCIVGPDATGLGRLFSSHPPTAARIRRLAAIEARVQAPLP